MKRRVLIITALALLAACTSHAWQPKAIVAKKVVSKKVITATVKKKHAPKKVLSKKDQFINFMVPKIHRANKEIMADRGKLIQLYNEHQEGLSLSYSQRDWLQDLAIRYKVKHLNLSSDANWQQLLRKVDVVPTSLVLAQAINESAWGRSRFAKLGNNYFGQWCFSSGCGIVPKRRTPGANYEVRRFASAAASIDAYMHNINAARFYKNLRQLRYDQRANQHKLSSIGLAQGLSRYSQRGQGYVPIIRSIITHFGLRKYDVYS